ncbi:Hypothetical predicted protein [Mytilus galloprovincialis]|uniref:Endonuclease/exonuclease/phosphatase domain-containing protein n=1 Tax=Mytilus galloprovincialis TaxID=29158 RepID=A0A8B6E6D9_MYTGA|nr:Hypothetical predicted protein [Mytilus galloprovincialis]
MSLPSQGLYKHVTSFQRTIQECHLLPKDCTRVSPPSQGLYKSVTSFPMTIQECHLLPNDNIRVSPPSQGPYKSVTSFQQLQQKQDIFCLQETHCDLDNCLKLPNFQRPVHLIRPRTKPSGKRHGGLSVYILNTIRPGVKFLEHATNDFIWLKLDRTFFRFQEDLYICFVYNPPENSSYYRKLNYNILEMIENDIVKYSQSGKIMIAGDLNARTACEIDHIQMDSDKHIPLFDNYKCDSSLIQRKSKDSSINTRGRQLLSYMYIFIIAYP